MIFYFGIRFQFWSISHIILVYGSLGDCLRKYSEFWGYNSIYAVAISLVALLLIRTSFDWIDVFLVFTIAFTGITVISIILVEHLKYTDLYMGAPGSVFKDDYAIKAQERYQEIVSLQQEKQLEFNELRKNLLEIEQQFNQKHADYKYWKAAGNEIQLRHTAARAYFTKISDLLPHRIWVTNMKDEIVYANDRFRTFYPEAHLIQDVLDDSYCDTKLFRIRDFGNLVYPFKSGEHLNGKSVRIFHDDSIRLVFHISMSNNFDKRMNENYLKKTRDLHVINEIGKIIIERNTVSGTLQEALDKIAFFNNLNSISIRLINANNKLEKVALSGYSKKYVLSDEISNEKLHMRYAISENRMIFLNKINDLMFPEPDLEKFIAEGGKIAYIPLANYNATFGVLSIGSDYEFTTENLTLYESIAINLTIALEKILLYDQLKTNYFKTVEAFVTATEINSTWFSGHSRRVAEISKRIAQELYLSSNEMDEIYMTGLLHDVGKMSEVFTGEAYRNDEDHSIRGRKMIEKVGLSENVLAGVEFHHMDFDMSNGKETGFTEQPYYAQMIRIANDLDWMASDNPEFTISACILQLKKHAGKRYSPQFIRILEALANQPDSDLSRIYETRGTQ